MNCRLNDDLVALIKSAAPQANSTSEPDVLGEISLYIDGDIYERAVGGTRWVRDSRGWWEEPLWPLDALQTFLMGDAPGGEPTEIRGQVAGEYAGTLDLDALARIQPGLHEGLLKGLRKPAIEVHVWLDEHERIARVSWALTASQLFTRHQPSWTTTEFWDFGLEVDLSAPPDQLTDSPATLREIGRDLWATRHKSSELPWAQGSRLARHSCATGDPVRGRL